MSTCPHVYILYSIGQITTTYYYDDEGLLQKPSTFSGTVQSLPPRKAHPGEVSNRTPATTGDEAW